MKTLISNRVIWAVAIALVLSACGQSASERPHLLTASEARISAIDPELLATEMLTPAAFDREGYLLHVACSYRPPSGRPRLIDSKDCVVSRPNEVRIF